MIETIEAVENLDAILDVPGVDGVFVGPNDLAISHSGTNRESATDPKNLRLIEQIAQGCAQRGLAAGISCASADEAHRFEALGYTLLGLPSDAALLGAGLVQTLAAARTEARVS
jgi:4-hydroxy-2-oxoheptanedioate aldolase